MKQIIRTECNSCGGTGLYSGLAEPKGTAVICLDCDGTGCKELSYTPFTKRKGKHGIKTVHRSRGSFITYQEFQNGRMP